MKQLIILILLFFSSDLWASGICTESSNGKIICQDSETRKVQPQQYFYDEDMKAAGKFELIAHTFYFTAFLGLGATYYCLSESQKYEDKSGDLKSDLTEQEIKKYKQIEQNINTAIAITGGSLIFGLIGHGFSIYYENEAHEYSLGFNKEL